MAHLVDDAELITSELVSNACRVAVASVTLALVSEDGALLLTVGDDSPLPVPMTAARSGALAESGRGLFVLEHLAAAWGTTATPSGKTVWVRLS
jgi:anti-sigma regulatory factor (Ser/Thr protein kinase)